VVRWLKPTEPFHPRSQSTQIAVLALCSIQTCFKIVPEIRLAQFNDQREVAGDLVSQKGTMSTRVGMLAESHDE